MSWPEKLQVEFETNLRSPKPEKLNSAGMGDTEWFLFRGLGPDLARYFWAMRKV